MLYADVLKLYKDKLKVRNSKRMQDISIKKIKEAADTLGFNYYELMDVLKKSIQERDYNYYIDYAYSIARKHMNDFDDYNDFDRFCSFLDNLYIIFSAKHFIIDSKNIENIIKDSKYDELDYEKLNEVGEDIYIDFADGSQFYHPVSCKICKANYTISSTKNKDMVPYNVSLVYLDTSDVINCFYTFLFTERLKNKVCVEYNNINNKEICSTCQRCNTYNCTVNNKLPINLCMMGRSKMENGCDIVKKHPEFMSPRSIMRILSYICTMYTDRNNLPRKNSKNRKYYEQTKISVAHTDMDDAKKEAVIDLLHYASYERVYKPWQGGHHKSPVAHKRRSHKRIYRNEDGSIRKVVDVKAATVNQNGEKPVYKL